MRQNAKFEIHLTPGGYKSYVKLNGDLLPMVRDIYIDARLEETPIVYIAFAADDATITGEGDVTDETPDVRVKVALDARQIAQEVQRILKQTVMRKS